MMLAFGTPNFVNAQKHAPLPQTQSRNVPGIYPEGSKRQLRVSDIEGLTSWDLKVMRNEIYARHNYIFKTDDMKNYFNQQNWYTPRYNNIESMLTALEKKNIKFIQSYE
ncbi:YARHG domain-containing protein [Flavobacterium procerum]|uniref:YARHG domain-containing protein n=2 Tax=Flavobacterium procerum TaxID=1455569 RepID=A0ABV6BNP5_9FLAO